MERTGGQPHTGSDTVASSPGADWLRATIDLAPIGIAHIGLDGRFLLANVHLCSTLGYTRDDLLARTLQQITHPDDVAHCMALNQQLALGKIRSYRQAIRLVRADGSSARRRLTMSAMAHGNGDPVFFVAIVEDIAEHRAKEAEEKLGYQARLLDITHEAVIAFDAQERITFWNRGAERTFGWMAEEVRGKTTEEVFRPLITEQERRQNAERLDILRRGDTVTGEYIAHRKGGTAATIAFTARAFFEESGALVGYVSVHRDVTDRRKGEAQLRESVAWEREARKHAEQAKKLRDETLAVVAHDLRHPLNAIALSAAAMMKILPPDDEPTRQLAIMRRSAMSMDRLIRDLLDVTRIEAGTFAIRRTRFHLAPLLDETCEQFEVAAREHEITLSRDVAPDVPVMVGDRDRLGQVLSNLVSNALKFTPPQGRVSVRAGVHHDNIQVSVQDTGPGVHPDSLPHIFDRFWQADRTSSAGAGLGLQIAKGIVEAHGGSIWAESELGRGTTFHFTVPVRRR